jgi:hypothetical protein
MSRDSLRNIYVTLGIPRDSHLYQLLTEEMTETGLTLSQIMVVRLADYYRPGNNAVRGAQEPFASAGDALHREVEPAVRAEQHGLEARAREAAAAWSFEEEP